MLEGATPAIFPSATYGTRIVSSGLGVAIVDLDGDGRAEIVHVGGAGGSYTVVLRNRSCRVPCYPNCDGSTSAPILNINDFVCFQARFAAGNSYANCDASTSVPILNVNDFICFQSAFAAGCP